MHIFGKDVTLKTLNKKVRTICHELMCSVRAEKYINSLSKVHVKKEKIRVGFIVQMPELWEKQESVYNLMSDHPDFDVYMIIVPKFDFVNGRIGEYSSELEFFSRTNGKGNIVVAYRNSVFVDISKMDFDYVFYQRPYNGYLPSIYRSENLVKYTKICYIPYATTEIKEDIDIMSPNDFFRNVYFGFMEERAVAETFNQRYKHKKHISFYSVGYPVFEKIISMNFQCNYTKVLWTPRWSYHPIIGGSHFFEYNDFFTQYDWSGKSFKVRPHPLMWENFIKENLISENDIELILSKWIKNSIVLDKNENIIETFKETDILISDISSVIIMFFLTGKPVIYCPFIEKEYSNLFSTILPGLYIANDEKDLKHILNALFTGEDSLKQIRINIINELFKIHANASNEILNLILLDAKK